MTTPGREYKFPIEFTYNATNAPMDLIEIVAPSDAVVEVMIWLFGQSDSETSEAFAVEEYEGFTASGSGGTSVTPDPIQNGDPAFGGTVETGNTTPAATAGTKRATLPANALPGLEDLPTPDFRTILSPGQRWVIHLPDDPTNPVTIEGFCAMKEIGG